MSRGAKLPRRIEPRHIKPRRIEPMCIDPRRNESIDKVPKHIKLNLSMNLNISIEKLKVF